MLGYSSTQVPVNLKRCGFFSGEVIKFLNSSTMVPGLPLARYLLKKKRAPSRTILLLVVSLSTAVVAVLSG